MSTDLFTLHVTSSRDIGIVTLPCHVNLPDFLFLGTLEVIGTDDEEREIPTSVSFDPVRTKEKRIMRTLLGDEVWADVMSVVLGSGAGDVQVSESAFHHILELLRSDFELAALGGGDFPGDFDMRRGHPRLRRV